RMVLLILESRASRPSWSQRRARAEILPEASPGNAEASLPDALKQTLGSRSALLAFAPTRHRSVGALAAPQPSMLLLLNVAAFGGGSGGDTSPLKGCCTGTLVPV